MAETLALPCPPVADGCIRLFIGTSTRGRDVARQRGAFCLRDHRALVAEIAAEFDINPEEIWNHQWFDYVRGSRAHDRNVYTTDDFDNACYYARALNESTVDALKTAHRIINDALMAEQNALPDDAPDEVWAESKRRWKESERAFIESWRQAHPELAPVIMVLDCPIGQIPVPAHVADRFTPEEWLDAVTSGGTRFAHEIPFPESIPYSLVVGELLPPN